MRRFITQFTLFLGILLGIILINTALNYLIFNQSASPFEKKNILIAGDSHPKCALDPNQFHDAQNIAQFAEPYILTYWKLKFILQRHQIDTIIIGFAPHNISAFNDRKFKDPIWSSELFKRSIHIGEWKTLKGIEVDWPTYYRTFMKRMCIYPHRNHYSFAGGYTRRENTISIVPDERIAQHYYLDEKEIGVSQSSIAYLDSILSLCQQKHIVPILVSNPVHPNYFAKIPPTILDTYSTLKQQLINQQIAVFDLTSSFYEEEFYYDMDHLNHKGAIVFSKSVREFMSNPSDH